jgi:hypothetical protein
MNHRRPSIRVFYQYRFAFRPFCGA